jgi:hypothetical protein
VPFTPAHAAAALPFRRTRLIPSALVVGTLAPDFEYFARLSPGGGYGHTLPGLFLMTLPLALAVLWLFHAWMKEPIVELLPGPIQRRIEPGPRPFRFWGPKRLALVIVSILVGAVTHIVWDSFTHPKLWLFRHWAFLNATMPIPFLGPIHNYHVFQYVSSFGGCLILLVWLAHWFNTTPPSREPFAPLPVAQVRGLLVVVFAVAVAGGLIRAWVGVGLPRIRYTAEEFFGDSVVTAISFAWLLFLVYGVARTRSEHSQRRL